MSIIENEGGLDAVLDVAAEAVSGRASDIVSDDVAQLAAGGDEKPAPKTGVQVIVRAARILRSLEDQPQGLSLGDIAARVDLPRSTVQRIVTSLAEEQFLIAATPKSRVKLGPALIRLARATNNEIDQIAHPFMAGLCRELNETIDLSVIQGRSAVFVDQLVGSHRLRAVSAIGEQFPLHSTACGKALLSTLDEDKLEQYLSQGLAAYTEHTITDKAVLEAQIEEARARGYTEDREEYTEGVCAIGVSFVDPLGRPFAISIPVPTHRYDRNKARFEAALLNCRDKIVETLGNTI